MDRNGLIMVAMDHAARDPKKGINKNQHLFTHFKKKILQLLNITLLLKY
jgi:hypothetical protein